MRTLNHIKAHPRSPAHTLTQTHAQFHKMVFPLTIIIKKISLRFTAAGGNVRNFQELKSFQEPLNENFQVSENRLVYTRRIEVRVINQSGMVS